MSLKKTFSADGKKCTVVFTVKKEAAQGAKSISIAGDFNSWSSTETPLKKAKDGSFSVELELATGKEYQFRYLLDGSRWDNDWEADKYIPAPFSSTDNSVGVCIENKNVPPAKNAAA
ncbi:MAG: isoamylase early set domain-containing protein [Treponemataceae bacterium]|nr:isoamylase early set domain-containing protein [Treponemataceae bacterium]